MEEEQQQELQAQTIGEQPDGGGAQEPSQNPLRTEPILKLIAKFSIPAVAGMFFNAIYNIVDRMFIGGASYLDSADAALAALQLCFPVMMICFGLALIFGIGGSVVFSIHLGKRDHDTAKAAMYTAFWLSIALFAVLTVVTAIFPREILWLVVPPDTAATVMDMAASYLRITGYGMIFQSINVFGNNFIRADGSPKTSMFAIILGAAVNIILDYVFVFVLQWGVEGAAVATAIGQAAASVWILYYFFGPKGNKIVRVARFRMRLRETSIRWKLVGKIVAAGFSAFVLQAAGSFLTIVLNHRISGLAAGGAVDKNTAIAAMTVINSVQTMLYMPLVGLNHGLNPIIGYNCGARLGKRAQKTILSGVAIASVFALLGWLAVMLFSGQIVSLFASYGSPLWAYTKDTLPVWLGGMLLLGVAVVGGNYFQASGKSVRAMILSVLRQVAIVIPLVLILPEFFGLTGLFYAQPISDAAVTVCVLILLGVEFAVNPIYKTKAEK